MTEPNFSELLAAARAGDRRACDELIRLYEAKIRNVARKRLGSNLRREFDTVDILQSIHMDLFEGLRQDKWELEKENDLVALAAAMVRHNIAKKARSAETEKRGGGKRPVSLEADERPIEPPSRDPTPSMVIHQRDLDEQLRDATTPEDYELLRLRDEGRTFAEIAEQMGMSPDAARMRYNRLQERLANEFPQWRKLLGG